MSIANKIIKNAGANTIGRLFDMAALVVITPLIFRYLGGQLYGLWSIVFVLSGYIRLADFGIDQSYAKFVAEYNAKNDYLTINKVLNTGFFFYLITGIFLSILVYINIDRVIFGLLKIPHDYGSTARISIFLAFTIMCTSNVFSCFSGLLDGLQRMDLRNGILIITRCISFIGVLLVIGNDWGIIGLTINASIRIIASGILSFLAGIKIFPQLRISMFLISKKVFKRLFSYGYKLQIALIGHLFLNNFTQIILSNILGLKYVAYYSIGMRVANAVRMVPGFLFSALIPAISDLSARMKKNLIDRIYYKGSKYLSFITAWLVFVLSTVTPYLFYLWVGLQNTEIDYTFYTMTSLLAIHVALAGIASSVLRGIGLVRYEMHSAIIRSCIILFLAVTLTKTFGFIGLLSIIFIAHVISTIYLCVKFNKINNTKPLLLFKKSTGFPFLLGLTLFGILRWIITVFGLNNTDKLANLIYLISFSLVFSLIYFGLIILSKYFSKEDIDYVKDKCKAAARNVGSLWTYQ